MTLLWLYQIKTIWIDIRVRKWIGPVNHKLTYLQHFWACVLLKEVNRTPKEVVIMEDNLIIAYERGDKGVMFGFDKNMNILVGLKEGMKILDDPRSTQVDKLHEVYAHYMGSTIDELRERIVAIFRSIFSKGRNKED